MITALLFGLGVVCVAIVMAFFGFNEVLGVMAGANLSYVIGALVLQIIVLWLLSLRIYFMSRKYGRIGLWEAFKISVTGTVISLLTPVAKIGGEPLKIYLLKKKLGGANATAVVAVDTLSEVISCIAVIFVVFIVFAKDIPGNMFSSFLWFFLVAAILLGLFIKFVTSPKWMNKAIGWVTKKIKRLSNADKEDYAELFHQAFSLLVRDRKVMSFTVSISLLTKIAELTRMWFIFAAIGVILPPEVIIVVWTVILVMLLVPWLPGSLGIVEFFGTGTLIFFGLNSTTAAGGLLLDRFISFWFVLVFGLILMSKIDMPKKMKKDNMMESRTSKKN
jgi:uncharacterized protein (TIRG00374 family)